jgi:hypothetical protein
MDQPTDDAGQRTAAATADTRVRLPWLPPDARNSRLVRAGEYWDAIRVPRAEGEQVAKLLGDDNGAIISDGYVLYWLILPGAAAAWDIPLGRGVFVRGTGTWVGVPGLLCVGIPHWRILPTQVDDYLTSAGLLHRALGAVLRDGDA